jgi:hypothetical protein
MVRSLLVTFQACSANLFSSLPFPWPPWSPPTVRCSRFFDAATNFTDNLLDTFPQLLVDGTPTGEWVNVRRTDNFNSNGPVTLRPFRRCISPANDFFQVTDVTSVDFRCYNQVTGATASTARVAAGSKVGFKANQAVYHQSVSYFTTNTNLTITDHILIVRQHLHG